MYAYCALKCTSLSKIHVKGDVLKFQFDPAQARLADFPKLSIKLNLKINFMAPFVYEIQLSQGQRHSNSTFVVDGGGDP